MRILFVSTLYPNRLEPTRATFNRGLIGGLTQLGHEVRVIAPVTTFPGERILRRREFPPARETIDGIEVLHPRFHRTPGCLIAHHDRQYRWSVGASFRRLVAEWRPDHVMLGFAFPDAAAIGPLCRELKLDWSVRLNGSDFYVRREQPGFVGTLRQVLTEAPRVLCPGQALAAAVAGFGIPPEKIAWFNNGVDTAAFHPGAEPPSGPRSVLFVGNLLPVKGADRLLPAWRQLLAGGTTDCELRIVGGGPLGASLTREAASPELRDSVRVIGKLPHAEVADCLRNAHCLVLPSRSEGMPNVVVEALACGVPVVGTAVGETPYLVKDGVNGFVVPADAPDLPAALAGAIGRCLERDWDRQAIAAPMAGFTWKAAAARCLTAISGEATA